MYIIILKSAKKMLFRLQFSTKNKRRRRFFPFRNGWGDKFSVLWFLKKDERKGEKCFVQFNNLYMGQQRGGKNKSNAFLFKWGGRVHETKNDGKSSVLSFIVRIIWTGGWSCCVMCEVFLCEVFLKYSWPGIFREDQESLCFTSIEWRGRQFSISPLYREPKHVRVFNFIINASRVKKLSSS